MIFVQIFDIIWLMCLLGLLFLIWRSSERRANQTQHNQDILVGVIQKNVETNQRAIQMTNDAFTLLKENRDEQPHQPFTDPEHHY